MLQLHLDLPDPLAALRSAGILATVAWRGDAEQPALVLVEAGQENLRRLGDWLALAEPRQRP
jgi:hypothetical protein